MFLTQSGCSCCAATLVNHVMALRRRAPKPTFLPPQSLCTTMGFICSCHPLCQKGPHSLLGLRVPPPATQQPFSGHSFNSCPATRARLDGNAFFAHVLSVVIFLFIFILIGFFISYNPNHPGTELDPGVNAKAAPGTAHEHRHTHARTHVHAHHMADSSQGIPSFRGRVSSQAAFFLSSQEFPTKPSNPGGGGPLKHNRGRLSSASLNLKNLRAPKVSGKSVKFLADFEEVSGKKEMLGEWCF